MTLQLSGWGQVASLEQSGQANGPGAVFMFFDYEGWLEREYCECPVPGGSSDPTGKLLSRGAI